MVLTQESGDTPLEARGSLCGESGEGGGEGKRRRRQRTNSGWVQRGVPPGEQVFLRRFLGGGGGGEVAGGDFAELFYYALQCVVT